VSPNTNVFFNASQDSRTAWSQWRSGTPSTASTISPSKAAWTGCPHLCVPKTSSTLCDQAIFVDQA